MANNRDGINWLGARRRFIAYIDGAQPGDLNIPITDSRKAEYTSSGATDSGKDLSRFYTSFIIQATTTNAVDLTIEVSADGVTWVDCPLDFLSTPTNLITAGSGIPVFVTLPCAGAALRLVAAQPQIATDFSVLVLMDDTHVRSDPKRG